ncbi:hypothetical protein [Cypionkella sp.]|uniref:hypothetical protein n=1 Tax=Cypionkella sp. TaxID=2811411 RepID=UPI002AB93F2E|nr:hypothetical protein [Cypionkella sp.]MDZ4394746.1 hypothetical protein [Cypionkella sp.]
MDKMKPTDATKSCEDILHDERRYNVENMIWPSQNVVIERLLARQTEVRDAYAVLWDRLSARPTAVGEFLRLLLSTTAVWNPERIVKARSARKRLTEVNRAIAVQAQALAMLLDERESLHNCSSFYSDTHYHIVDLVEIASAGNGYFQNHVRGKLQALREQFDLKYWPQLGEVMQVLARDADQAEAMATNPMTEASTQGSRASQADFFKALFAAVEENRGTKCYEFPAEFELTDSAFASFANVLLDLGPDDLVDAAYVKRLRQREREAKNSA